MSEPFLGEIRMFAMDYAPQGWTLCNGQLLNIRQNAALYSLLGTSFGGDGVNTFALPNLQGRAPIQMQNISSAGQTGGEESHTLTINEIPQHTHQATAGADSTVPAAAGNTWGGAAVAVNDYASQANVKMAPTALATAGKSQAHSNMQPYLAVNFCIATVGNFPPRD